MVTLTRRQLSLLGALAALGACKRTNAAEALDSAPTAPSGDAGATWQSLKFAPADDWPDGEAAQVLVPQGAAALPTVVALHGRGESGQGLDVGAHGWQKFYELGAMHDRLLAPPLTSTDVKDFLDPSRLAAINESLATNAFKGLVVACPYTPDLNWPDEDGARAFGRFIINALLPRTAELTGGQRKRELTGIDGVSMGGRLALLVGLGHPEIFGSVGALQPQLRVSEARAFAELAVRAHEHKGVTIRLVSSDDDPFLDSVQALASELDKVNVPHKTVVTHGPHDYIWNKGPGGCELLVYHERNLRGLDPP